MATLLTYSLLNFAFVEEAVVLTLKYELAFESTVSLKLVIVYLENVRLETIHMVSRKAKMIR
jgi:hypothetical protein